MLKWIKCMGKSSYTKEEKAVYNKNYVIKNRLKIRKYKRKYNKMWRKKFGYHNESNWKTKHPKKVRAQRKLQQAVKNKKIIKLPCEYCKSTKVIAHHDNYNEPFNVRWVCKTHHRKIHYETRKNLIVDKRLDK